MKFSPRVIRLWSDSDRVKLFLVRAKSARRALSMVPRAGAVSSSASHEHGSFFKVECEYR